jgi:hypothetical protein
VSERQSKHASITDNCAHFGRLGNNIIIGLRACFLRGMGAANCCLGKHAASWHARCVTKAVLLLVDVVLAAVLGSDIRYAACGLGSANVLLLRTVSLTVACAAKPMQKVAAAVVPPC